MIFKIEMSLRTQSPNILTILISKLMPKPRFNYTITPQPQASCQQLKEALAHTISTRCNSPKTLHRLHARSLSSGLGQNLYICTQLITKYFHFGDPSSAHKIFDTLRGKPISKTLVWNSLIKGYLRIGMPRSSLDVFDEMLEPSSGCDPDKQTFHLVIMACTCLSEFELGYKVEGLVRSRGLQADLLIATVLINFYSKAGDVGSARRLFNGMLVRDAVAWNAMISGYSRAGCLSDAMGLYKNMRADDGILPTESTLVSLASGCGDLGLLRNGKGVHAHMIKIGFEANLNVSNSMMAVYIACDRLDAADNLFNGMVLKDAISWSTMIGGYLEHERPYDALSLFHRMVSNTGILPTRPILLSVILACADTGDYQEGKWIKEKYLVNESGELIQDAYLITALIYMYAKCGEMGIVLELLDEVALVREDVVAWNAVMKACVEHKQVSRVFEITLAMQRRGIIPDAVTFLTLLLTISSIPLPTKGMETHGHIIKRGFESERTVANSLIDMYAKSGSIGDSFKVFSSIREKDVVSWSLMIKAYAWNGSAKEALDLFQLMRKTETRPNHITFLAILSACSHAGLVDEGRKLMESMKKENDLEPGVEHFTCMVDIFCRAGLLKDAHRLLKNGMRKDQTDSVLWGTLLSACRLHGDVGMGEEAARHLFLLEPNNAANYLMLGDIYSSAGQRQEANRVLDLLRGKGLGKRVGCSWFDGS
nr:pentatricopeptide repeat protein AaPPR570 [Agave angustifolia]UPT48815.1 pentatricopeptide repeat protein AaPPR852 [Agave angustifolia]